MATNFPTSLDILTNPTTSDTLASADHVWMHGNIYDAIEAIETKIGITGSSDVNSLDYKSIQANPLTTKWDIFVRSGTSNTRLPVGADWFMMVADSTQATGLKYISPTGGGTVTSVSVVSANGFTGSVATATTTPAITLTTNITGILKWNGTAMSAAVAGTDYLTPTGNWSNLTGIMPQTSGFDGIDGAFSLSSGTTTLTATNGIVEKFYSSMSITGGTLNFSGKATNWLVAILNCSGNFIMSAGTIDISGQGWDQTIGGMNYLKNTLSLSTTSQTGALATYLPAWFTITKFCWGGGGQQWISGAGWNWWGLIIIRVLGSVNFTGGTINANGTNGTAGGGSGSGWGGWGAGGTVVIQYGSLTANSGTITVNGWNGWDGWNFNWYGWGGGGSISAGWNAGNTNTVGTAGITNSYGSGGTGGATSGNGGGGGGGAAWFKYVGKFFN